MKSLIFSKSVVLLVFLSLILPGISNSQQVPKLEEKPDFSKELRAIIDCELEIYHFLKKWIYFDAIRNEDGSYSYVRNEEKMKRISKDLFEDIDLNAFSRVKASWLESKYRGDNVNLSRYAGKAVLFINKVYEHYDELYKELVAQQNQEKRPTFIIPKIPVKDEYFSMKGGLKISRKDENELKYPDVLDIFSESEKIIIFRYFIYLLLVSDEELLTQFDEENLRVRKDCWEKGANKIFEKKYFYASDVFNDNSKLVDRVGINEIFTPTGDIRSHWKEFWEFYESLSDERVDEIDEQVYRVIKHRAKNGKFNFCILLDLNRIKLGNENCLELAEKGIDILRIVYGEDESFRKKFYDHFGVEFGEFKMDTKSGKNDSLVAEWFKNEYQIEYDQDTYLEVDSARQDVKLSILLKLYLESLFEKALKFDPNFDLLEYVQARTHLIILAAHIENRLNYALWGYEDHIHLLWTKDSSELTESRKKLQEEYEKEMLNK